MIQRIQSIFLLLASGGFWSLFKLPFANSDKVSSPIFEDSIFNLFDNTILLVLAILGGIISISAIFLYNNRQLQLRLGYLNIICALFLGLVACWLVFIQANQYTPAIEINDNIGLYMPLLSLIFAILANYFIKKDDKLVDSMDRLR